MAQHKWHKEIKAWADGTDIQWKAEVTTGEWVDVGDRVPMWHRLDVDFRIKPQHEEEPYWLCCGCKDPRHNKSCSEAKMGHPERCKFGTASEHFKPQPKEPQYLYVYKNKKGIDLTDRYRGDTIFVDEYIGKIKLETDDGA